MGAGLAGVRAAASLRERGYSGELTLLGAEREPPYDRPPLSKKVLLADADPVPLDPSWYAGATLVHGRATELAPGVLGTDAGELPWDGLVLATGAEPRRLSGSDGAAAVLQYSSTDLRHWAYDGILCSRRQDPTDDVPTGAIWECPQLFRLGAQWVLIVSV